MAAPVLTSRKHSRGVVWSVANPSSRVNTSEPRESASGNPRSEKSDFQLAFRFVDSAVESREHARGTARVVAFVPKRTRAPRATPHRETRGGPRRDEIPSRPGRSRCCDSAMGLDLGVTGRAAVGSAGPPRATTKAVHPLRPSGGRLSEHLWAVRHRREGGVDAGVEGRGTNAVDRDAQERAGHGEGGGRGSAKGGGW
jgi:hypothetical protein